MAPYSLALREAARAERLGNIWNSEMLRPRNPIVKALYYTYLRGCLGLSGLIIGRADMPFYGMPGFHGAVNPRETQKA